MDFYVPTIGDKIYLTKDWTFNLHHESRNIGLADRLENQFPKVTRYHTYHKRKVRAKMCGKDYPSQGGIFSTAPKKLVVWCSQTRQYGLEEESVPADTPLGATDQSGYRIIEVHVGGVSNPQPDNPHVYVYQEPYETIDWSGNTQVTLPAKTCLRIDRIYIKKNAPTFDSITFYVEECSIEELNPATKKKNGKKNKASGFGNKGRARFWVKLKDANRIQCSLYPVDDVDAPAAEKKRFNDL